MLGSQMRYNGFRVLFALQVLETSSAPLVLHFATSTIGRVVSSRWAALAEDVKRNTRECLLRFITVRGHEVPAFVSSKTSKVLVDVAKHEWPHSHPSFLSDVLGMAQSAEPQVALSALQLLRMVGEEFVATCPSVRAARQDELRSFLTAKLPQVGHAIYGP